jgi:NADH dehydrogenase [ubiquinone] 1 alpha subcomplex assembly factor 7
MPSTFESELRSRIETGAPLSVADYMEMCVAHYYATRDPLGRSGDFITAPEISQMFGELIGLWAAAVWRMLGEPAALNLVELGPGRGTLMADALRAASALPAFKRAISVHLVETSPLLRDEQRDRLRDSGHAVAWHDALHSIPPAPAIFLANEFFDALPVHQAIRQPDGWRERIVDIGRDGSLQFRVSTKSCDAEIPAPLRNAPAGSVLEWRRPDVVRELATHVVRQGAALIVDYGHVRRSIGDTLQAVRGHTYHPPLADPGAADLTAHVDFEALANAAASAGARVQGPVEQGVFLRRLGIEERAAMLKGNANSTQIRDIEAGLDRLTATAPAGMGRMFKAIAFACERLGPLPGFDG